jgi:hypothetical protein
VNEVAIHGERVYEGLVEEIITTLPEGRARAIASVAEQRFMTDHAVGRSIITRQQEQGWGAKSSNAWPLTCGCSSQPHWPRRTEPAVYVHSGQGLAGTQSRNSCCAIARGPRHGSAQPAG